MRIFAHCSTAIMLAVHVLLGCCAHHGHSGKSFQQDDAHACAHACPSHACENGTSDGTCGDSSQTSPSDSKDSCDGEPCLAIVDSSSSVRSTVSLDIDFWTVVGLADSSVAADAANRLVQSVCILHECGPPLRTHLLNQVLLI